MTGAANLHVKVNRGSRAWRAFDALRCSSSFLDGPVLLDSWNQHFESTGNEYMLRARVSCNNPDDGLRCYGGPEKTSLQAVDPRRTTLCPALKAGLRVRGVQQTRGTSLGPDSKDLITPKVYSRPGIPIVPTLGSKV